MIQNIIFDILSKVNVFGSQKPLSRVFIKIPDFIKQMGFSNKYKKKSFVFFLIHLPSTS